MTVDDVRERIEAIRGMKNWSGSSIDDPTAHAAEDALLKDVLSAIANSNHPGEASELAAEALKSSEIVFARWYE